MSGFAASQDGPQSLSENSARPDSETPPRTTRNKARRLLRKGLISREAVRHVPGLVIVIGHPHHDYDRHGIQKADDVEASTA
jgi:hypothetical protein